MNAQGAAARFRYPLGLSADSAGKALHVTTVQGANGVIHASNAVIMPLTVA